MPENGKIVTASWTVGSVAKYEGVHSDRDQLRITVEYWPLLPSLERKYKNCDNQPVWQPAPASPTMSVNHFMPSNILNITEIIPDIKL